MSAWITLQALMVLQVAVPCGWAQPAASTLRTSEMAQRGDLQALGRELRGAQPPESSGLEEAQKFGTDGVRWIIQGNGYEYGLGRRIGMAAAVLAREQQRSWILVGRDGRDGGDEVQRGVVEAARALGVGVMDLGLITTPLLQQLVTNDARYGAGVVITASHNPAKYIGAKIIQANGEKSTETWEAEVANPLLRAPDPHTVLRERLGADARSSVARGELADGAAMFETEIGRLAQALQVLKVPPYTIIVDAANSPAASRAWRALRDHAETPAAFREKLLIINQGGPGHPINDGCGAEHVEKRHALPHGVDVADGQVRVTTDEGATHAFAMDQVMLFSNDGDADRSQAVIFTPTPDAEGHQYRLVDGDRQIVLAALTWQELLRQARLSVPVVIAQTVMADPAAQGRLRQAGITFAVSAVGDKYVHAKAAAEAGGDKIAEYGEASGHRGARIAESVRRRLAQGAGTSTIEALLACANEAGDAIRNLLVLPTYLSVLQITPSDLARYPYEASQHQQVKLAVPKGRFHNSDKLGIVLAQGSDGTLQQYGVLPANMDAVARSLVGHPEVLKVVIRPSGTESTTTHDMIRIAVWTTAAGDPDVVAGQFKAALESDAGGGLEELQEGVHYELFAERSGVGVRFLRSVMVTETARLPDGITIVPETGSIVIGEHAQVLKGATISGSGVIGTEARVGGYVSGTPEQPFVIGPGARVDGLTSDVRRSVVGPGVVVQRAADVAGTVVVPLEVAAGVATPSIGTGTIIEPGATVVGGAVGTDVKLRRHAVIGPFVTIGHNSEHKAVLFLGASDGAGVEFPHEGYMGSYWAVPLQLDATPMAEAYYTELGEALQALLFGTVVSDQTERSPQLSSTGVVHHLTIAFGGAQRTYAVQRINFGANTITSDFDPLTGLKSGGRAEGGVASGVDAVLQASLLRARVLVGNLSRAAGQVEKGTLIAGAVKGGQFVLPGYRQDDDTIVFGDGLASDIAVQMDYFRHLQVTAEVLAEGARRAQDPFTLTGYWAALNAVRGQFDELGPRFAKLFGGPLNQSIAILHERHGAERPDDRQRRLATRVEEQEAVRDQSSETLAALQRITQAIHAAQAAIAQQVTQASIAEAVRQQTLDPEFQWSNPLATGTEEAEVILSASIASIQEALRAFGEVRVAPTTDLGGVIFAGPQGLAAGVLWAQAKSGGDQLFARRYVAITEPQQQHLEDLGVHEDEIVAGWLYDTLEQAIAVAGQQLRAEGARTTLTIREAKAIETFQGWAQLVQRLASTFGAEFDPQRAEQAAYIARDVAQFM